MRRVASIFALILVATAARTVRAGDGVVLSSEALPVMLRARLESEVRRARVEKPQAFSKLAELRQRLPELDRRRRGRLVPVGPMLRGLGRDALLPMLEMIALDAAPRAELSDSAWLSLRVGLLEAAGSLRDPRAAPIFSAVLDGPESEYPVLRAAAEALGRLGDDAAAKKLVALAAKPGKNQRAVLAAMGDCRRIVIASALAEALANNPDAESAELVAHSLGRVGNAWAWRTPAVLAHSSEQAATRATAARALVDAFVKYDGRVRRAAGNAILIVDDPSTLELIAAARRKSPAAAGALDTLALRIVRNPTR